MQDRGVAAPRALTVLVPFSDWNAHGEHLVEAPGGCLMRALRSVSGAPGRVLVEGTDARLPLAADGVEMSLADWRALMSVPASVGPPSPSPRTGKKSRRG